MKNSIIVALTLVCTLPLACGGGTGQAPDPSGTVRAGAQRGAAGTAVDDKGTDVGDDNGADVGDDKGTDVGDDNGADDHADGGAGHGADDVGPETEPAEHEDGGHRQGGGGGDTGESHGGHDGSGEHG